MAAVAALTVLFLLGLAPALAVVGTRPEAVAVAVLVGAAMATAGATIEVVVGGDLRILTAAVAATLNASAAWHLFRHPPRRMNRREFVTFLGPLVALGWTLQTLRRFEVGWDGRSIWLLHARLLYGGHDTVLAGAKAAGFSHVEYPVLTSAPVALAWEVMGRIDYRTGQLVIAGLIAAAASLVGLGAARAAGVSSFPGAAVAGVLTAVLYGTFAGVATNGYVDPLCAALTAAALGYGLLIPPQRWSQALSLALLALTSVAKNEGFAYAVIGLIALLLLRPAVDRAARLPALAYAATGAVMAAWPLTVRVEHFGSYLTAGSQLHGQAADPLYRLGQLTGPAVGRLTLAPAALLAAVVLLQTARSRAARRGVTLYVVGSVGCVLALTVVYVVGPIEIHFWIATSLARTTMTVRTLFLLMITIGGTAAARALWARHRPDHFHLPGMPAAIRSRTRMTTASTPSRQVSFLPASRLRAR